MGTDYERLYREGVVERLDKLDQRFDELSALLSQRFLDTAKEISQLRTALSVVEAVLRIKAGRYLGRQFGAGGGIDDGAHLSAQQNR